MSQDVQPDPSMIGGVPTPPFAFLPDPVALFQTRAKRLAFLAETSDLAPYLRFLADLARLQARLCVTLPAVQPVSAARQKQAAQGEMPPIDRLSLATDPALAQVLDALCEGATDLEMPAPARLALDAVRAASESDRHWLLTNILSDHVPEDSTAPHLFAAAAVQVHLARLSATLDADALVPVGTGVCPSCGGKPVSSSVMARQGIANIRYATCACCATQWNEVRVKCLCCGSTKGIGYRSVETTDATVKAEICRECKSWVKIFYLAKNPSLDPVADDIGSVGLDMLMGKTDYGRGGFNPYLIGY